MKFEINITDPDLLAGLTAAREWHNLTAETPLATDADYVQHVMERACESYANTYVRTPQTREQAVAQTLVARQREAEAKSKADRLEQELAAERAK